MRVPIVPESRRSRQLRYYYRKRKGINVKESPSNVKESVVDSHYIKDAHTTKHIRIHALAIKQEYQHSLTLVQIEDKLETAGITYMYAKENNTIYYFITDGTYALRLTTLSITAWAPEHDVRTDVDIEESELRNQLRAKRAEYSKLLSIELKPEEEVVEEHIAFVEDYFARLWKSSSDGRPLSIPDKVDGKERRRIDYSKGHPEYEFTHRKHSKEDALKYDKHVDQVTNDVWNIDKQLEHDKKISDSIVRLEQATEDLAVTLKKALERKML